jgi:hypothetical protein
LVVHLGDCLTRLTVCLIYLLHRCFRFVGLIKPCTADPLASERFLLCRHRHASVPEVALKLALRAAQAADLAEEATVLSFVPMTALLSANVLRHVVNANERFAVRELMTLRALQAALLKVEPQEPRLPGLGSPEDCAAFPVGVDGPLREWLCYFQAAGLGPWAAATDDDTKATEKIK